MRAVDYTIVDATVAPAEGEWSHGNQVPPRAFRIPSFLRKNGITESRVYLPHSYQANDYHYQSIHNMS